MVIKLRPFLIVSSIAALCFSATPSFSQSNVGGTNNSNFGGTNNSNFGGTNNSNFTFGSTPGSGKPGSAGFTCALTECQQGPEAVLNKAAAIRARLAAAQAAVRSEAGTKQSRVDIPGDGVRRFLRSPGSAQGNKTPAQLELERARAEAAEFLAAVNAGKGGVYNPAW